MKAPACRRKRQPSRRKARSKAAIRADGIVFDLVIEGQRMIVHYAPRLGGSCPLGHFEFRSPYDPPRRIPVSATGYRSHFAAIHQVAAAASPEAFARDLALALLRSEQKRGQKDREGTQLSLF